MDPLVYVVGAVVTVVGSWLVARSTGRSSERVSAASQATDREKNAVDGFAVLTRQLEERVGKLEHRVEFLEEQLSQSRHLFRVAVAYIERLLDYIAEHPPASGHRPPVPPDLREHIDDGDT